MFHFFRGKYCINCRIGAGTNPFSPLAEPVSVPFKILLMILWHMFRDSTILFRMSFQPMVGNTAVIRNQETGNTIKEFIHMDMCVDPESLFHIQKDFYICILPVCHYTNKYVYSDVLAVSG